MPTRWQRFLAAIDHLIGWSSMDGSEELGAREYFYQNWGRKIAIVEANGNVRFLGNSMTVVHEHGPDTFPLLSRKRIVKTLQEGERVAWGHAAAYNAYDAQARFQTSGQR